MQHKMLRISLLWSTSLACFATRSQTPCSSLIATCFWFNWFLEERYVFLGFHSWCLHSSTSSGHCSTLGADSRWLSDSNLSISGCYEARVNNCPTSLTWRACCWYLGFSGFLFIVFWVLGGCGLHYSMVFCHCLIWWLSFWCFLVTVYLLTMYFWHILLYFTLIWYLYCRSKTEML